MSCGGEVEAHLLDFFRKLDVFEQLIFLSGVKALAAGSITTEQFTERVGDLFARYRSGEDLTLADLQGVAPEVSPPGSEEP